MNYYPKNVGAYARRTLGLTQGQHGAYNLLLDACYVSEDGIPADEAYEVSRAANAAERKNTDKILKKYFELRDGRYYNSRVDEEISAYHKKVGQTSSAARKRWEAPITKPVDKAVDKPPDSMQTHMRTHSERISERNADGDADAMQTDIRPDMRIQNSKPSLNQPLEFSADSPERAEEGGKEGKPNPLSSASREQHQARVQRIVSECHRAKVEDCHPDHPTIAKWLAEKATETQIIRALTEARSPGSKPFPQPLPFGYVDVILQRLVRQDRAQAEAAKGRLERTQQTIAEQQAVVAAPPPEDLMAPYRRRAGA